MPDVKEFGYNVAKFRMKKELSQEELAVASGLSRQTINSIENNGITKTDKVRPLCSALDVSPDQLFGYQSVDLSGLEPELVDALTMLISKVKDNAEEQKELSTLLKIQAKHWT